MSVAKYEIFPDRDKDNYSMTLYPLTGPHGSLREELNKAILKKVNSTDKPMCLLVSGGLDSQMLLLAARENKIPFIAVHIATKYKGKRTSQRCIDQVNAFAKRHDFTIEIVEIEVEHLLHKYSMIPSMNIARYRMPYIATHSVIGLGADVFHYGFKGRTNYGIQSYVHNDAAGWVLKTHGLDVDFNFYQYTPELYYGYLYHRLAPIGELFLKDNPDITFEENGMIKFMYHYYEYGDELIYFAKRRGLEDYPEALQRFDDRIWNRTSPSSWIYFTDRDTLRLYKNEVVSITKTSTVDPVILKHVIPPRELLGL